MTPAQAQALRLKRYQRVLLAIERWEAKQKRATNALRKLRRQRAYYLRMLANDKPEPSAQQLADRRTSVKANTKARASAKQREVIRRELAKASKADSAQHGQARLVNALMRAGRKA